MKTHIFTKLILSLAVIFLTFTSFAKDWYVNNDNKSAASGSFSAGMDGTEVWCTAKGSNSNVGSKLAPFLTLTYALTQAGDNDRIFVDAGTYSKGGASGTPLEESLTVTQSGLQIIGAGSNLTIFDDVVNGGTSGRRFIALKANNIILQDFYITRYTLNGGIGMAIDITGAAYTGIKIVRVKVDRNASETGSAYPIEISDGSQVKIIGGGGTCNDVLSNGGGVHISNPSTTVDFYDYLFVGNDRYNHGGALRVDDGTVRVYNSIFSFNNGQSYTGCGIFQAGGDLKLFDCVIEKNTANIVYSEAGGIIKIAGGSFRITRSIVTQNSSGAFYGTIGVTGGTVSIDSTSFSLNTAGKGKDIYLKGGVTTIKNCTFSGASSEVFLASGTVNISGSGNPTGITGEIDVNPPTYTPVRNVPTFLGDCSTVIKICSPPTALPVVADCDSIAILSASINPNSGIFYWYDNLTDANKHIANIKSSPSKWKDTSSVSSPQVKLTGIGTTTTYYVVASADGCSTAVPVVITYKCPPCKDSIAYDIDSVCIGDVSKKLPKIFNASNPTAIFSISPINAGSIAALDSVTGQIDFSKFTYDTTYTITLKVTKFCKPKFNIVVLKQVVKPSITITQATCTKNGFAIINNYDSKLIYTSNPALGIVFKGDSIKSSTSCSFTIRASNTICYVDSIITFNAVPGKPVLSGAGDICVDSTIYLKAWTDNTLTIPSTPNSVKPWVSSNTSVATVLNGDVLGKSGGTVTITYTDASNCTQTASIKVSPKAVGGIASATSLGLCSGTSTTINLTGYTGSIQWQSSPDGTNWTNIPGATTTPYTTSALTPGTYYYRAFVTSGVCSGTATSNVVTITVSPSPILGTASSTPDTLCAGVGTASLKLVGSVGNIQWKESLTGNSGWNNITGTPDGNLPICGTSPLSNTMFYKAVLSSGACTDVESTVLKVVVKSNLAASVTITSDQTETAGEITICPDTKVIFTATPSAGLGTVVYQWKNKGVTINLANKSTYSSAGLKDGDIITCELTTVGGKCITGSPATSNPIKVNVLVNDLSLIGSSPTSCNLLDGFIEVKGTGSGTVKWSLVSTPLVILGTHPGVTLTKVAPFETVSGLGKGNYRITFNNGFCDFSKDVTLTDPSAPQDALLSVSATLPICQGQSITITANVQDVSILTATTKYHWRKDGLDFNGSQPQLGNSITANVSGTYSVVLEDGACTSNANDTIINITPTPVDLTVSNVSPKFCKSDGKLVSDLAQVTTNLTQTITWYDAPVNGTAFKDADLLLTGTYYAEQSEGTCKSTNRTKVDVTIIDLAKPILPGNNTQPTCSVATGSVEINMPSAGVWDITATPVVGNPVKVTTDKLTTNPFTYSFAGLDPGSYTFQLKDENGCLSPNSTAVVIDQQPVSPATPILDATAIYCTSKSYTVDQITFSPAPTGTVKYYDANGVAISGKTVVVANTVYKFSFDNGKCESKVKLSTTIPFAKEPTLIPLVDLSTSLLICAIDKPTFNSVIANSTVSIPGGYSLLISATADGKTIIPNTTEIGSLGGATQTVYYNIIDDKGCQSTTFATLKFKINEGPKDLVLKNTKTYCATDNPTIASLSDTKIFSSGALKWYSSETSTNVLPVGTNLTSGTYFASATLTPGCESVARQSVVVTVQTFGQTTLDPTNTYTFCKGSNKTIADLSTKPYFSNEVVWLNGNKVVQTPSMGLLPGTYFATETKNGCVSPNAQEIEVKFTSPIISITPSKLPTCGAGNGVFVITGADASYTYQWSKNGQLMTEKGSQISNLLDDHSIKYSVVVTDKKGCVALDTAVFTDCDPAATPHIITPNGDGKNDKFVLNYESKYPKCSVTIFNRWGAMIYETKEVPYKDDWDGKPNVGATLGTNVLPAGTYFYMIEKGDGTTPESGYVELVK